MTAFQALLVRYTRRAGIAIGTDAANHARADPEGFVGFLDIRGESDKM
jgi:hypothetical protein